MEQGGCLRGAAARPHPRSRISQASIVTASLVTNRSDSTGASPLITV